MVLANVELATDEHSYGSSSLHMHKSHTSQKQSATVEYEKDTMTDWVGTLVDGVEMQEDSSSEWPRLSRPQMSNTTAPLPNKCPSPTPARGSPSTPM